MLAPGLAETSAFIAVLEQKSFTKAARQLGLSLPRVSELVRNLEENLGVRLVERTTRSVSPTLAGEHLLERLRPVLDDYRRALESTNEFRDRPAGLLRLTIAPPAADFLAPLAQPFLALYPEISLEFSVDSALVDIVTARFDAGIRPGERLARDMIAMRVSEEIPIVVAASPGYLAEHGVPQTPRELAMHNCLRIRLADGGTLPWRFRGRGRTVDVHVEGRLIVNELAMMVKAAVDGAGLIWSSRANIASELASGELVTVLDEWMPPPVDGLFLYYPSRRQMRPALKAFVDFLRERRHRGEPLLLAAQ